MSAPVASNASTTANDTGRTNTFTARTTGSTYRYRVRPGRRCTVANATRTNVTLTARNFHRGQVTGAGSSMLACVNDSAWVRAMVGSLTLAPAESMIEAGGARY